MDKKRALQNPPTNNAPVNKLPTTKLQPAFNSFKTKGGNFVGSVLNNAVGKFYGAIGTPKALLDTKIKEDRDKLIWDKVVNDFKDYKYVDNGADMASGATLQEQIRNFKNNGYKDDVDPIKYLKGEARQKAEKEIAMQKEFERIKYNADLSNLLPKRTDDLLMELAKDPIKQRDRSLELAQRQQAKAKEGLNGFGEFAVDAGSALADMAMDLGFSYVTKIPINAIAGYNSGTQSALQALGEGYSAKDSLKVGLAKGTTSGLVEGLGGIGSKVTKPVNGVIFRTLKRQLEEGGEEALEYYIDSLLDNAILSKDSKVDAKEMLYNAAIGSVVGTLGGNIHQDISDIRKIPTNFKSGVDNIKNAFNGGNKSTLTKIAPYESINGIRNNGITNTPPIIKTAYDTTKLTIPQENSAVNNQLNQKSNARIIDKLTNTPISDEADNVLKRLENDENVSVEEMYRIPEISNAKQKIGGFIPTSEITTPQRQALRQEITDKLYKMGSFSHIETIDGHKKEVYNGNIEKNKIADIVIGAPAAGKSSVFVNPLSNEHKSRVIDSDMAKELLPEFDNGYGAGVVHEESTDIAKKLLDTAIKNGENIVYPILGSDLQSLVKKIDRFKENGYTVNLHLNELSANKAAGRAIKRFFTDGRFLDPALLNGVGNMPTQNYKVLRKLEGYLDGYSHYSNDVKFGEQPIRYETNIPIKGTQDISNANGLRSDRTQEIYGADVRIEGRTQTQGTGRGEQPEITSSNRRVI